MQVQPYLFFDGRREEAADFYRRTIGAEEYRGLRMVRPCNSPCLPRRA
jgi:PhnB protein